MFGIDELYEELLLEAKTPEEIAKIMRYQFVDGKGVPEEVFKQILESDPTRKKNFAKWVLMRWGDEGDVIKSSLLDGSLSEMFKYYKERANDGLNLLNMKTFSEAMGSVPKDDRDPILSKDDNGPSNDFDILYNTSEWAIAVPNTVEASVKLGTGSKWCTAGYYGSPVSYYNQYTNRGKLYVNFDKRHNQKSKANGVEYPYTRYQFCFEASVAGELQDLNNDRIDFEEMDMPNDVLEFYGSINEEYVEKLEGSSDETRVIARYNQIRMQHCALRKNGSNCQLLLLPEYNEDLVYYDDSVYCVYTEEDLTDPLDWGNYDPSTDIISTCGDAPMLIMRNSGGYDPNDINVYYLDSQPWRRDNNGYWSVLEDVRLYGHFDDVSYAIDDNFRRLYMAFPNEMSHAIQVELPFRDVDMMENITLDGMPSEYNNGKHWVKMYFENGFYGLFYIDTSLKDMKIVIKGDKPIGEEFVVENNNGKYIIRGKLRDYTLFSDDEDNGPKYNVIETIGEDDNYYIRNLSKKCSVHIKRYNESEPRVILFNESVIIEDGDFIVLSGKFILEAFFSEVEE